MTKWILFIVGVAVAMGVAYLVMNGGDTPSFQGPAGAPYVKGPTSQPPGY